MSVNKMPNTKMYWSTKMRVYAVSQCMTRKRFDQISSWFHLSNNHEQPDRGDPNFDVLFKVRKFMQNICENFQKYADPEVVLSVDEQMVPFKGKHQLKVYMKNKPTKWGVKIWALAGESGYVHKLLICGDKYASDSVDLIPGVGASGQTVLSLCEGLEAGTNLFFDNYFASPHLLVLLKERNISAACTLRSNRIANCPLISENELKKEGRGSVDSQISSDDGIMICKWYDNKVNTLITAIRIH